MKTAIRSSTFWWTLVFVIVVMAPTPSSAAGAPTPAPTPAGESYYITWNETMKGRNSVGVPPCEHNQSSATNGEAIVRFKYEGNPPELKRDYSRIIWGNLTDEQDSKCHFGHSDCGDFVQIHEHWSYQPIQPIVGMDWWMQAPAKKQDDGSWVIPYAFNGESAYIGPGKDAPYIFERQETECEAPCLEEGPQFIGCVKWGSSALRPRSIQSVPLHQIPAPVVVYDTFPRDAFDLKSADPNLFHKEFETNAQPYVKVKWEITVRRIGKCRIGNSIPIIETATQSNPDINDEDIGMGVEHGSDSIDPDTGIAALNIRVTCDQVPIKNAKVDVKVVAQKNTGGHVHDTGAGRPRGSLKWNGIEKKLTDAKPSMEVKTDDDGRAHLTFKPGKAKNRADVGIAGIYRITATPFRFPVRKAEVVVEAKVDNLSRLDADPNYVDDIHGAAHTSGDNATAATKQHLSQFARNFHDAQEDHNTELAQCGLPSSAQWNIYPLWVIDVSLPFGGLYDDIDNDWATPHQTHGRGDGVDFSVNPRPNSPSSATQWPKAGTKMSQRVPVCEGFSTDPQGWLMTTMMQLGTKYGHWDAYDLCQHPNVCAGTANKPWVECCPDNVTCPSFGPGGYGPPMCPGAGYPAAQCLHCPTDQLWHLHVNQ